MPLGGAVDCLGSDDLCYSNRVPGALGFQWVPSGTSQREDIQGGESKAGPQGKLLASLQVLIKHPLSSSLSLGLP